MIVAGFGFRNGVTEASLRAALAATGGVPDAVATVAAKAPALACLDLPVIAVPLHLLHKQQTLTEGAASRAAYGTGSVAEASALAALGPGAHLLAPRSVSPDGMATAALAKGHPL
ncbi:cobalamin biosynthesis protein [Falsirhodobacter sp. alg1]|uniref:cobalamin biosynthesis protein n=1 Tax=Falsirhodobacter sp. alg1 TaxID=1472418 RepID=UPI0005EFF9B5|nr:cobalamin biosynthesis protein [Falsirhodobacter sp. alg1]